MNVESDIRGLTGNYKMFVKIYPHWKHKERLKDSSIMLRMRVNLAVWLRVFVIRLWNIRFVHQAIRLHYI